MIEYIIQTILWTLILYFFIEIIRMLICKFLLPSENIEDIIKIRKTKTKSENEKR